MKPKKLVGADIDLSLFTRKKVANQKSLIYLISTYKKAMKYVGRYRGKN